MKKVLSAALLLVTGSVFSYGQCDKKVVFTASKTVYLGADSSVQRTVDEQSEITFDKTSITIIPGANKKMTGTINSYTCNWQTPFKEGKMVLQATMYADQGDGEARNITITIEGKGGKISFLGEVEGRADKKISLTADKFEEKAG